MSSTAILGVGVAVGGVVLYNLLKSGSGPSAGSQGQLVAELMDEMVVIVYNRFNGQPRRLEPRFISRQTDINGTPEHYVYGFYWSENSAHSKLDAVATVLFIAPNVARIQLGSVNILPMQSSLRGASWSFPGDANIARDIPV